MSLQSLDRVLSKTADRSVGDIVATYGSNVQKLKMDAAAGKIDPTKAVMAMMAIQRIVAANTQPPPGTTVAQDTGIAPPPQPMMPPPAAPQQAPVQMAYGGQVAVSNNQVPSPAMERGLDGIPVPDNMFDYAEGGMIAFADGGDVQRFQTGNPVRLPYSATSSVGVNPVFPSGGSGLSYGSGMNPTGASSMRMPPTFDYRMAASRPGLAAVLQDPLSRINPTGFKQFAEQVSRLAPHLDEVALEKLYQQTAGSVSKAVNVLKGLGTGLGIAGASMAVEEATGMSPEQQMVRGIRATNPVMGAMMSGLERLGIVNPVPTEAQKVAKEAAAQPIPGRERGQEGYVVPPVAETAPPKDTKAEEKARVDTAVSEARRIIGPTPKLDMPKAPALLDVPKPKTLKDEIEIAQPLAKGMYQDHPEAKKTLDDILKGDRETLTKQGYDFDMIKNMVAETRAEREKIPAQRKEAANLRLLEAGLAIMGGSSPYAFVNIGKGASEAAKGFNEDMKEFRKLDREYRKELQQLQSMQNQETLMLTTEGKKRYERIQDKVRDTEDKRANAAFQIGQNAVNLAAKREETVLTLNNATNRTIYQTEAELRKAQAQMENQTNIALAQIGAQRDIAGRPSSDLQLLEYLKDPKNMNLFREMQKSKYAPRAEADLQEEYTKNYAILRKDYPTYEDYKRAMMQAGGGRAGFSATELPR